MKRSNIVGEQHIQLDGFGNIAGVYTIDAQKARAIYGQSRFWEGVTAILTEYTLLNPTEMEMTVIDNALTRQQNKNKTGSNMSGSVRHCLSLPIGLMNLLEEYEPTLFTNKKMRHQFMKQYPNLRACAVL